MAQDVEARLIEPGDDDDNSKQIAIVRGERPMPVKGGGALRLASIVARDPERAVEMVKAWGNALSAMTEFALGKTRPQQWILNRDDKSGEVSALMTAGSARTIMNMLGISVFPDGDPQLAEEADGSHTASVSGYAYCALTDQTSDRLLAQRNSREKFVGRPVGTRPWEVTATVARNDLASAARALLDRKAIQALTGLQRLREQDLVAAGVDTAQCVRGHGFGSGAGRRAQAAVSADKRPAIAAKAKALGDLIIQVVGGEVDAARALLQEVSGKESVRQLTTERQLETANAKLREMKVYQDWAGDSAGENGGTA